ncbi:arylsulfatase [Shewanella kaireitica]|uniref:arylsulfatase n=1 Tax=Shewanella kaireitica TaxID=212021 RepID=UPI00200BD135|nr:arylsulfatase [Shewanella kaireitica]MCL1094317.1 arylsulfatase [Shewanella kaireitica]
MNIPSRKTLLSTAMLALSAFSSMHAVAAEAPAPKSNQKPNILVMWGDDIGTWNISYWNRGLMGYETSNIDRIANEGVAFTDYYGEQSCTAGRSAFITGQDGLRTGMTKVGLPGAPQGIADDDLTIAEALKNQGYMTGQFGKNHLGDRDRDLPTNHGFDEFYGFLYHLNAMEEPEHDFYPKDPKYLEKYGPRGVISAKADGEVKDTGPLTVERMRTIDDDVTAHAIKFMDKAQAAHKPFFVWWNSSKMHFKTHINPKDRGISGQGFYNDAMMAHDRNVGELLDYLDDNKLKDNTIVMYGTDNGPHFNAWPDGAITPFRGEKETNWEGAYRVPAFVRWPAGDWSGGRVLNGMVSGLDFLPTLTAAAGDSNIKQDLLKGGYKANGKEFKIHLDGFNMNDYFAGRTKEDPRKQVIEYNADAQIVAIRYNQADYVGGGKDHSTDWKVVYGEQRAKTMALWAEPFTWLRLPKIFNLRQDPFERADHNSNNYWSWELDNVFVFYKANELVKEHLATYKDFPPSQRPGSFTMDGASESVYKNFGIGAGGSKTDTK